MVSILDSIKQLLGIDVNDNNFDAELIIHINGALMIINQLGVGPEDGYSIVDKNNTWDEFVPGQENLEAIKSSVYLRVRSIFDPPQIMVSILDSIKQLLGIDLNDTSFDKELIMHINGALMIINQLGVGPEFYSITDKNNVWEEFTQGRKDLEIIKSFVYLKVRLMFDPPQNSFLVDSIEKQISEYEWRITVQTNKLVEVGDTI